MEIIVLVFDYLIRFNIIRLSNHSLMALEVNTDNCLFVLERIVYIPRGLSKYACHFYDIS